MFREGDQWMVFALDGDRVRKRAVEIGRRNGLEATNAKGLAVEEKVIVYPSDAVEDGLRV